MADQDWGALAGELYTLLGPDRTSGALWQAWEHAKDVDHDEFHDAAWNCLNDDEMWAYEDETVTAAESAYTAFHAAWKEHFYDDRSYVTVTRSKAETWDDDVTQPLRNEPTTMGRSDVADSWYGTSAQKYAGALQTQTAAMSELNQMTTTLATSMNQTRMVLQGLMLSIKDSCTPVRDALNDCKKDSAFENSFHKKFFENITNGRVQFEGLRDWMQNLADGDWKHTMETMRIQLEDTLVQTTAFAGGSWPVSTTGQMQDMQNGRQPGAQPPGQQPPGGAPYTPVDTGSEGSPQEQYEQQGYNEGVNMSGAENDEVDPNAQD